jgi:hypothetical protein
MRPVAIGGDGAPPMALEAGDRISVVDSRGTTTTLVVTTVGTDSIEGTAADDRPTRIAISDVREISERRGAPGKSVGLGVGLALALFVHALSNGAVGPW